jgi:arsenate reductase
MKRRVIFLCTGNSARSQMAEGFLRHLAGDRFEVMSAGTEPKERVNPLAVRAMAEAGVDISGHAPKDVGPLLEQPFDLAITVCDRAREACPVFPGARRQLHWSFEDPAAAAGSEEERLQVFRRVRDAIRQQVERLAAGQLDPAG